MRIEYFHASKYGNGAMVAEEFKKQMASWSVAVTIHRIRDARQKELPPADLYLFSSPGRMGKPIGGMRRFLEHVSLPTDEEMARWQRVIPIMNELLQEKGLVKAAEGKVLVSGLKGPLEEGWQKKG